jgi:hypothetical protein
VTYQAEAYLTSGFHSSNKLAWYYKFNHFHQDKRLSALEIQYKQDNQRPAANTVNKRHMFVILFASTRYLDTDVQSQTATAHSRLSTSFTGILLSLPV